MKVGDLVKRKPEWGDWVKHNPWMYTDKDFEIGMIVQTDVDLVVIHWPSMGANWEKKDSLEKVNESR
jgi:hypothetical protein